MDNRFELTDFDSLPTEIQNAWLVLVKYGDEYAKRQLVTMNLRRVVGIARRLSPTANIPIGQLVNAGIEGLLKSAERFDPSKGFRFVSYSAAWIRYAIQKI